MKVNRIRGYPTLFKKLIWISRKGLYTTTRLIYGVHFLDQSEFRKPDKPAWAVVRKR